ncbi:LPS-assembly protein LptD [Hoeflea sp. TYP-13]|uniref:LPS-assembly protein LptD n=1 Tax=Hoeflea sp. TYP-13 TaxID=3230023 RepID=UPI0034C5C049
MGSAAGCEKNTLRIAGLIVALTAGVATWAIAPSAFAQNAGNNGLNITASPDARLLLTANQLTFNQDTEVVVATGAVRVDYDGYQMVARRLEYHQRTGRLKAFGDIEMIEPDGNKIYAQELDVTDDFADGFVNALRIERPDNTRIVADSAQRLDGERTTLNNGVYTACDICEKDPSKPPLWQIKARRVTQNGKTRTIRLEGAHFEMFGQPIAYIPFLTVPDHTVKRKSGFLLPSFSYSKELGAKLGVPYYFALNPHYDLTVTVSGYSRQGFLTEAEFRQRFENGSHVLKIAGIHQLTPEAFSAGTVDASNTNRGLVASQGEFQINPRWMFGWDVMLQSDNSFANTYGISGYNNVTQVSTIYLTGLSGRNYFDMRSFYFDVQSTLTSSTAEKEQPIVHPSLDYSRTFDQPVMGGELNLDVNVLSLTRRTAEIDTTNGRYPGVEGTNTRLTTELEWKRTFVTDSGLLLTPMAAARGDVNFLNVDAPAGYTGPFTTQSTPTRGLLTAGLEARYPVQIMTTSASHVLEPIGQIFVRNDEQLAGGLPNEDAQSFVFDASTLFERDKFSGYDRIEGGTRANVGFRYTGTFNNGVSLRGVFGQSYQIAGLNSFATDDLVNVGSASGLETTRSDFVGSIGMDLPSGFSMTAEGRFDERSFELERSDIGVTYTSRRLSTSFAHTIVQPQPGYGSSTSRNELKGSASLRFAEFWRAFGSMSYDIEDNIMSNNTVGFGYNDECFAFSLAYTQERDVNQAVDWSIGARISLRTLGDINFGSSDLAGITGSQ